MLAVFTLSKMKSIPFLEGWLGRGAEGKKNSLQTTAKGKLEFCGNHGTNICSYQLRAGVAWPLGQKHPPSNILSTRTCSL